MSTGKWTLYVQNQSDRKARVLETNVDFDTKRDYYRDIDGARHEAIWIDSLFHEATYRIVPR